MIKPTNKTNQPIESIHPSIREKIKPTNRIKQPTNQSIISANQNNPPIPTKPNQPIKSISQSPNQINQSIPKQPIKSIHSSMYPSVVTRVDRWFAGGLAEAFASGLTTTGRSLPKTNGSGWRDSLLTARPPCTCSCLPCRYGRVDFAARGCSVRVNLALLGLSPLLRRRG